MSPSSASEAYLEDQLLTLAASALRGAGIRCQGAVLVTARCVAGGVVQVGPREPPDVATAGLPRLPSSWQLIRTALAGASGWLSAPEIHRRLHPGTTDSKAPGELYGSLNDMADVGLIEKGRDGWRLPS